MVNGLAADRPGRLAVFGPDGEQESAARSKLPNESREQGALFVPIQVKEAVPRNDDVVRRVELHLTHVRHDPPMLGESSATPLDHGE